MNAVHFGKGRIVLSVMLAAGLSASAGLAETESPYATGGEVTKVDLGNCRVRYIHVFTNTDEFVEVSGGGNDGEGSTGAANVVLATAGAWTRIVWL